MMKHAALKYPDKSEAWRREKIIYDLMKMILSGSSYLK